MDNTGEQLHPNWRALATVHIPVKRFIKEGTWDIQKGHHDNEQRKYELSGIKGDEIKEFYENLVHKPRRNKIPDVVKQNANKALERTREEIKQPFEVGKFFRCATKNNVKELKMMNYKDENINVCDSYGWTALMMAACEGSYEAAVFLLNLGANKYIKDKAGKTAQDLALKKCNFQIVELLENNTNLQRVEDSEDMKTNNQIESFYCDTCKQNFTETNQKQHKTSTLHQFNMKSDLSVNKLQKFNIPVRNKGLQLMIKQGWDKESGLGPSQSGRLYPVKTVIRKQRSGLGIEQQAARVTHFEAFDRKAVQRPNSDFYKKKSRNRNDIKREKVREWKRDRRLRNELN